MNKYHLLPVMFALGFCCNVFADHNCSLNTGGHKEIGRIESIRGHLSFGFELSGFKACGDKNWWWFSASDPTVYTLLRETFFKSESRTKASSVPRKALFIEGEACVSALGEYGHMGGYKRLMELKILKLQRPAQENDCINLR